MSLAESTTYEYLPPIKVAPDGRRGQWKTYTHRYICLCEVMERGSKHKRTGWLPSYNDLKWATGRTWRTWGEYDDLLSQAGVIEIIGRGGRRWKVGYTGRRQSLTALPYDLSKTPPEFTFTRESVSA